MVVGEGVAGNQVRGREEPTPEGTLCCDKEFGQIPYNFKQDSVVIRTTY